MKDPIYQEAAEYAALHNEDCCVNFPEDARACDGNEGPLGCCENMQMVKGIVDATLRHAVEYLSHDMEWASDEQRKAGIEMYLSD